MNTVGSPRYAPEWLALREDADARARSGELLGPLHGFLSDRGLNGHGLEDGTGDAGDVVNAGGAGGADDTGDAGERILVHDLGCGTGSMGRWLAARLDGPQRWFMNDRDPALLADIAAHMPRTSADGSPLDVVPQQRDITRISADDLAGASLVTASALLDLLTADELESLAAACAGAGSAVLLALSVEGRVELDPHDPLDARFEAAFNAHQRRTEDDGRRLLGPDAVKAATASFEHNGFTVLTRSTPWRLGPEDRELTEQWLTGWVAAACVQEPSLVAEREEYLRRRLDVCRAGGLRAVVHHRDLLALPARRTGGAGGAAE